MNLFELLELTCNCVETSCQNKYAVRHHFGITVPVTLKCFTFTVQDVSPALHTTFLHAYTLKRTHKYHNLFPHHTDSTNHHLHPASSRSPYNFLLFLTLPQTYTTTTTAQRTHASLCAPQWGSMYVPVLTSMGYLKSVCVFRYSEWPWYIVGIISCWGLEVWWFFQTMLKDKFLACVQRGHGSRH